MNDINYELYKVFYCVATTLSFSEAAKHLYISQSAVSQAVKALETKLGQQLFVRSTKKITLTAEGEILFEHISPAISLIRRGESQMLDANTLEGGQLRIGASDTICRYYLVPFLNRFHKQYPGVHIKVTNRTSLECVELLKKGLVDLIITNHPNSALIGYSNVHIIKEFRDVFLASRKYFNLENKTVSLKALCELPLLMLTKKSTTSEFLYNIFRQHNLELIPEFELSSNDLLIDLARIGLGIAFIPDYCVPKADDEMYVIRTKENLATRHLVAAFSDTLPLSPAAKQFLNMLEAEKE